ncbi:MAG: dihydrofolate reductase family protein [Solirubrobacteraceae bacterium]
MGKLIEATHVTLGGEVRTNDWAFPYLDDQHSQYNMELLTAADALLLERLTYEGLSVAYTRMADQAPAGVPSDFIGRMNSIPKFVASTAPRALTWNAATIDGDVASFVDDLKRNAGQNLLKYGNGPLDATLKEHGQIDEFQLFLAPVAIGKGNHLSESIDTAPHLRLVDVTRFDSGVLILVYAPK